MLDFSESWPRLLIWGGAREPVVKWPYLNFCRSRAFVPCTRGSALVDPDPSAFKSLSEKSIQFVLENISTFYRVAVTHIHQQALPGKDFCLHLSQTRAGVAIKAIVFIIHSDGWPSLPLPPSFIVISCFVIQRTRESRRVSKLLVVTRLPDEQTTVFESRNTFAAI